jgi:pilus assembly protein CpaF
VHANSAEELPARLEALGALGRLDRHAVHSQVAAALQVALHLARCSGGQRVLTEVAVFRRRGDGVQVVPAWRHDAGPVEGWADLADLLGLQVHGSRP